MADKSESNGLYTGDYDLPELELSNEDILDAMQHIPGYLDISTEDFREIYHLSHRHALMRLFSKVRASGYMRVGIEPLHPDIPLDQAAGIMARQGLKNLPVVDSEARVIGMLTETDFLRRLKADTFLELMLKLLDDVNSFSHRCHETPVSQAMTTSPVSINEHAGFFQIITAFRSHEGQSMPVINTSGHLLGLMSRKDFMDAFHLEDIL